MIIEKWKIFLKKTKLQYFYNTKMRQKFCNILVVHDSLWHVYHIDEPVQTVKGTCYGCLYRESTDTLYITSLCV